MLALAAAEGVIYVGGDFDRVGDVGRRGLAAFSAASGALTAWNPQAGSQSVGEAVQGLVVRGGTLYAAGTFETVGEEQRHGFAAFELATGVLTAWDPKANYESVGGATTALGARVNALVVAGDAVFVGGFFNRIGAAARVNLAAVDARTGQALPWRADVDGFAVQTLAVVGDRLYVGGSIYDVPGLQRPYLASVSATTGQWLTWNPRPNGPVWSVVAGAGSVAVGGDFYGLGSERHDGLSAIDLATSAPLPFGARFRGIGGDYVFPTTLAAQGNTLFASGYCGPRNDCHRSRYLARFDTRTGAMRRWNALAGKSGMYGALAVHGRRLYVGGRFGTIGGRRRSNLAAIDTRTGRVTRWRADTDSDVRVLLVHGHTLHLAGAFRRVNGHRRNGTAAIDLRSGRLTAWNPHTGTCCGPDAMVVAGKRVYLGGRFLRKGDRPRFLVAANRTDGRLERWNPRLNGPVNTLAVIGDTVYAGGKFTSVSGARRHNIAAIDAATGTSTAWTPGATRGSGPYGDVWTLLATPAGLLASGDFDRLGGVAVEGFGVFPRVSAAVAQAAAGSQRDRPAIAPRLSQCQRLRARTPTCCSFRGGHLTSTRTAPSCAAVGPPAVFAHTPSRTRTKV